MRSTARTLASLAALVASVAAPALAHETLHEVARGKAVAVRASHGDGEVLADTAYQVYSPADPKTPYQEGRTDRSGWLAFVPDVPGKWRVKVIAQTGHGLDVLLDAAPQGAAAPAPAGGAPSSVAFVLRPLLGLAAIAAVFALLFVLYRRKGTRP